ncbi:serine hydrolase domain-containing protein [Pedococcus sp. 5OH_020]|uniref:serine hydrolase domain-containing protein n=1 Tax=Pedococcus sp. 5OH_020 TaxID=2989814 RepID=UPI0022E9C9F3|nr:serine hydrolase domain-containing protein [Pedococcus sp. 5OH_020]
MEAEKNQRMVQREHHVAPGFEPVARAFFATIPDGRQTGAAVSVWVEGTEVVSLWAGTANPESDAAFTHDSLLPLASVTKGLAALLVARLVEREALPSFDTPIGQVWPEFAAHGKGGLSIGDVLAHRGGVSAPRRPLTEAEILDPLAMADVLAEQEPLWPPGEAYQYHNITHGALTAKLISIGDGRSTGRMFAEEITGPLGVDAWIGLPEAQDHRLVTMALDPSSSPPPPSGNLWLDRALDLGSGQDLLQLFYGPKGRRAEVPGAGGIGTAQSVAKIWSATVTPTDGVRLISEQMAEQLRAPRSSGAAVIPGPPPYQSFGAGVMIPSHWEPYLTADSFGHDGAYGQVAFADPYYKVGFGYLTSQAGDWERGHSVVAALNKVLR